MKIKSFLLVFLCVYTAVSSAQDLRQKYIGIESGITLLGGEMTDMDYVRRELSFPGNSRNNLTSLMYKSFIGVKSECFTLNNKFGLSGGVRFSRTNSSVGKNNYWSNTSDYFYVLYRQDGINTEYLKVKEINQKSDYVGIPVEIRYFPFKPRLFRLYFKLGAEIGVRLNTQTDVVFDDDAMEPYQDDIAAFVGKPGSFTSSLSGAAGIRLGRESKPSVSVEMCLPTLFLTSESAGLVNPISGGGFQFNFQIPLKSKVQ